MIYREQIEWCDTWIEAAGEETKPRVLLIGDSITRSYYPHVRSQLAERYACARIATSKCVADPAFFKELGIVLSEYRFSIIHFNNGLHGWSYDENAYRSGLARAFDEFVAYCGAAHVIWGTTTPVWKKDDSTTMDDKTERVRERNKIAAALAHDRGIYINDLFSEIVNRSNLVSADGVHLLEEGQILLGKCVAEAVQKIQ